MKPNQERLGDEQILREKESRTAEASRGMTDEGCPNDLMASVSDATGYSGGDDATERQ